MHERGYGVAVVRAASVLPLARDPRVATRQSRAAHASSPSRRLSDASAFSNEPNPAYLDHVPRDALDEHDQPDLPWDA